MPETIIPIALSSADAAKSLGVSRRTLARLIASRKIVARLTAGRQLVEVASLRAYFESLPVGPLPRVEKARR